eukprot:scaffold16531_cov119-Skeletonema_dohrnii-CCMP3373.AAC.1
MPPRRVLPSRHARTGIISYSDTQAAGAVVPSGGAEVGTGEIGENENSTYYLSDDDGSDDIDETQDLTAILPNGRELRVKIKVFDISPRHISPQKSPVRNDAAIEAANWQCHLCGKSNMNGKKRCGHCQAWKGGMRENIRTKKQKPPPPTQDVQPIEIKHHLLAKPPPRGVVEDTPMEVEGGEKEDQDEGGPAGSRPKRKRTNVYSSLSEAVIKATSQARAEAFMAAAPVPQHQSKVKTKPLRDYVHPGAVAAEKVIAKSKRVPDELVGNDGNLFYCRVCLGVGEVVCCDGCPHVFHPFCLPAGPSKTSLENDDDPWYCHDCIKKDMKGRSINPKKKKQLGGKGGRGAGGAGRYRARPSMTPSDDERSPRGHGSGYQSPFVRTDEDDEEVGPEALASVQKPTSSTPAFFFFLLHNRSAIEKRLYKRNRFFRAMPKGLSRNEKVAQEGAAIWVGMNDAERNEWIEFSMKDFEQRVVAWKEKVAIHTMIDAMDGDEAKGEFKRQTSDETNSTADANPDDEGFAATNRARLTQFSKVKSQQVIVGSKESNNGILLELLKDIRFRPLPLISTTRDDEDLTHNVRDNVAIQKFIVEGPVETCIGDDCLGCTRGWSHFCLVLKRHIPSAEHRAKLQPPVSSLFATRIGLGLKANLPHYDDDAEKTDASNSTSVEDAARLGGISKICPTYQPRNTHSLDDPSLRKDDATAFIESAIALKTVVPGSVGNDDQSNSEKLSPSPGKVKASSRLLPMRGRTKSAEKDNNNEKNEDTGDNTQQRNKCGKCGNLEGSSFGCIPCRRAQLISQISKRDLQSFYAGGDGASGSHDIRYSCVMLGRSSLQDVSHSGSKGLHKEGLDKVGLSLTKEGWAPNAVMPPRSKQFPMPKLDDNDSVESYDDDESMLSSNNSSAETSNEDMSVDDLSWCCDKCGIANESSSAKCGACQQWKGDNKEENSPNITSSSRSRSCTTKSGEEEPPVDRHSLALKHKEEADELSQKCLTIACCGILAGMIRRDPMRLFAEPVKKEVAEYHKMITDPIDFSKIKEKIFANEYSSLGAFINDARKLCINACVFNAADTLYATTAKEIFDSLEIMADRAKKWIAMLKNAHATAFTKDSALFTKESAGCSKEDIFKDVRLMWPGAVELLEEPTWLNEQAKSDFVRTKENEIAYYGALAVRRTAAAAEASMLSNSDFDNFQRPVVKRSHLQDELLRRHIDQQVSIHTGSIQLSDVPNFREEGLLTLLKRVQKRRAEARLSSDSGSARCDGFKVGDEVNVSKLRRKFKRTLDATKPRVLPSRLAQSTGLASRNAQEASKEGQLESGANLESIGQVMTENKVSVQGSRTHGWGLFCDKPFSKGEVVAEYIGEYVTDAVADGREKYYRKQRIQDYQFRVDKSLVIDATHKGGYARYINHSCNPNCAANIVKGKAPNEHLKRVIIVAQRDIKATEELSYDYQFPLEMNIDSRIPCNCGSRQCRGFMNWDIPEKARK